jgi:uncharacterized repeat protein (TIGR02543 family)
MATIDTSTLETINYNGTEVRTLNYGGTTVYVKVYLEFNEAGGSGVADKYVYYQRTYGTLPTTTRSGYTFNGWFTQTSGGTQITPSTTVTSTATFQIAHAQWTSAGPTTWTYIGTSGGYNSTTNAFLGGTFCGNSSIQISAAQTQMNNNFNPANYSSGHIFRVTVYTSNFQFCSYRYFRAD